MAVEVAIFIGKCRRRRRNTDKAEVSDNSKSWQQQLGSLKPLLTPMSTVLVFVFLSTFTFQCILKYSTTANPLSTEEEIFAFVQDYKRKSCTITKDISAFMLKPG